MPELSDDVPSLPVPQGWGLGFHLVKVDLRDADGRHGRVVWDLEHLLLIDRAAGIGGVIMTQVLPFFDLAVVEKVLAFEAAAYAQIGAAAVAPAS